MKSKKEFQTGKITTIAAGHFIHDVFSSFLSPILPLLIDKLSLSLSTAGLLSLAQRFPAILNPLIGLLADKVSARVMLAASPLITVISMSLLGLAPNLSVLILLLLTMGIGASLYHVPAPVVIRNISGKRVGKGMSFFMFGGEIARSAAPIVILSAVSLWTLEGTYRLIPIGFLTSIILYIKLRDVEVIKRDKAETEGIKKSIANFLPLFINIIGVTFFLSLMRGALTAFLPTYITSKGNSLWAGGLALSSLQITGAAGTFLSGTISDKIGRVNTLLLIAVISPAVLLLFVFSPDEFAVPVLLVLGFFIFGSTPVILAMVNEAASDRPSLINAIYITINFAIGGGTVLIAGMMGDLFGLESTYKITALLSLISIPFIFRLRKNQTARPLRVE